MDEILTSNSKLISKSKSNLLLVDPDDIEYVWEDVIPLIEKALVHSEGELIPSDILEFVTEKNQQLWVGMNEGEMFCAGVTEIIKYPRKRVLRIITFATESGHDYEMWKDFVDIVEGFGVRNGCSSIEAWTRKGLARKLNWDNEYSVITKDIKSKWQ